MAADASVNSRQQGLQQAASVIFALVAIVPLLIFAWTLHTLGVIGRTQAQVSLGLALAVALLGFWLFRSMLGRMAEVVQALAAAVEQANRTRRPPNATAEPAPPATPSNWPAAPASAHPAPTRTVPGLGQIRELSEVGRTMDELWHREASAHLGRRVQISVANSSDPLVGTLSEATGDGLVLAQDEGEVAISYGRVTAIDRQS
ncbi:MAG TPA: hypothetical protein VFV05_22045 [Methylomirabilota bacterium]|nr:hypothetical protein [Methylomirabilota bacterium]